MKKYLVSLISKNNVFLAINSMCLEKRNINFRVLAKAQFWKTLSDGISCHVDQG